MKWFSLYNRRDCYLGRKQDFSGHQITLFSLFVYILRPDAVVYAPERSAGVEQHSVACTARHGLCRQRQEVSPSEEKQTFVLVSFYKPRKTFTIDIRSQL